MNIDLDLSRISLRNILRRQHGIVNYAIHEWAKGADLNGARRVYTVIKEEIEQFPGTIVKVAVHNSHWELHAFIPDKTYTLMQLKYSDYISYGN